MNAISINFADFVQIQETQLVTNSKFVAKAFGKRHDNVLTKIDELKAEIPANFHLLNFKEMEIETEIGLGKTRLVRTYQLTKDGFMLLVMGFTGKQAMQIKIAYIEAFNAMAEQLKQLHSGSLKLTPEQKQQIREAVRARHHRTGEHWQAIYEKLHSFCKVNSYHEILASDFQAAMQFLASIENAPKPKQQNNIVLSDDEITKFATTTYYLTWATQQLKDLSAGLRMIGADKQGARAWTLWHETRIWLRDCQHILEANLPKIQSDYYKHHVQDSLYKISKVAQGY